jgi:hypothetical protein
MRHEEPIVPKITGEEKKTQPQQEKPIATATRVKRPSIQRIAQLDAQKTLKEKFNIDVEPKDAMRALGQIYRRGERSVIGQAIEDEVKEKRPKPAHTPEFEPLPEKYYTMSEEDEDEFDRKLREEFGDEPEGYVDVPVVGRELVRQDLASPKRKLRYIRRLQSTRQRRKKRKELIHHE